MPGRGSRRLECRSVWTISLPSTLGITARLRLRAGDLCHRSTDSWSQLTYVQPTVSKLLELGSQIVDQIAGGCPAGGSPRSSEVIPETAEGKQSTVRVRASTA